MRRHDTTRRNNSISLIVYLRRRTWERINTSRLPIEDTPRLKFKSWAWRAQLGELSKSTTIKVCSIPSGKIVVRCAIKERRNRQTFATISCSLGNLDLRHTLSTKITVRRSSNYFQIRFTSNTCLPSHPHFSSRPISTFVRCTVSRDEVFEFRKLWWIFNEHFNPKHSRNFDWHL